MVERPGSDAAPPERPDPNAASPERPDPDAASRERPETGVAPPEHADLDASSHGLPLPPPGRAGSDAAPPERPGTDAASPGRPLGPAERAPDRPSRDLFVAGGTVIPDPQSVLPEPMPVGTEGPGREGPEAGESGRVPAPAPANAVLERAAGRPAPGPADAAAEREVGPRVPAPVPARLRWWAVPCSLVLPGSGQLLSGAAARGLLFLFPWVLLLGALYLGWGRALRVVTRQEYFAAGNWVAVVGLALTMLVVWSAALVDLLLAPRRARRTRGDSQWRIAARHFRRSKLALGGVAVIFLLYAVAILAPLVAPFDPIAQPTNLIASSYLAPLSGGHLLGTDQFGRDVLSRILYGARISLAIGFVATAIAVTLGTLLGAVAGYFGRWLDAVIMRFTDMVLAFPRLVLLILVVALFSPSLTLIILVLGLTQWPTTTRIVRGDVLSLREREYIQAARALGYGGWRIIFRHLVPNVLAPVIVTATLGIGNTIVMEAGLSFLGLGVQPPTPSWGSMVADGRQNLIGAWWVATFPGLAIVLTVLAFNLVGDGLRDALDPRLRD